MARIAREITRFPSKKAIDELFKKARRVVQHPGLHLLVAPKQRSIGHILIIVPRAVGSAPERNKIRRQIKSIVYEHKLYDRGLDCIAIVKKGATDLSFEQLKELVLQAYDKNHK